MGEGLVLNTHLVKFPLFLIVVEFNYEESPPDGITLSEIPM
jgi:hypothetical protein